jgi:hypothetical protein
MYAVYRTRTLCCVTGMYLLAQNGGGRRRRSRPRCPAASVQAYSPRRGRCTDGRASSTYLCRVAYIPSPGAGRERTRVNGIHPSMGGGSVATPCCRPHALPFGCGIGARRREHALPVLAAGARSQLCLERGDPSGCRGHTVRGKISARAAEKITADQVGLENFAPAEPPAGLNTTTQGYSVAHHYLYATRHIYISFSLYNFIFHVSSSVSRRLLRAFDHARAYSAKRGEED